MSSVLQGFINFFLSQIYPQLYLCFTPSLYHQVVKSLRGKTINFPGMNNSFDNSTISHSHQAFSYLDLGILKSSQAFILPHKVPVVGLGLRNFANMKERQQGQFSLIWNVVRPASAGMMLFPVARLTWTCPESVRSALLAARHQL